MKQKRDVPCGSCTLCCRGGEAIMLHPEDGDIPSLYQTNLVMHPLTGRPIQILKQKPDGSCIYLSEAGCTIYNSRPTICRAFDCRLFVKKISGDLRKKLVSEGLGSTAVFARGEELLKTDPL
jgi:Fe-S-cluster containining protein